MKIDRMKGEKLYWGYGQMLYRQMGNTMKFLKKSLLLVLFYFLVACSAETTLNTGSVNQMLDDMLESVQKKDADKLVSYFTADAVIILDVPPKMGGKREINKSQYAQMLKEGWATPAKFTYEVKDIKIKISKDKKKATVSDITLETVEMNGKIVAKAKTQETMEIVLSDGKPEIKSLYGKILF